MGVVNDEIRVLELARSGDRGAMRQIYDGYSKYLAAVCSRFLTDREELLDVLQETFVKVFSSLDRFDYRGEGSFRAWIRQIGVNESLKILKSRKRLGRIEYKESLPDLAGDEEPDVDSVPPEEIQRMVKELPELYRTVFNLFVFENRSHREIGKLLGIAENSSASRFFRAKALLADKIKDYKRKNQALL